jgi:hypothetical protein
LRTTWREVNGGRREKRVLEEGGGRREERGEEEGVSYSLLSCSACPPVGVGVDVSSCLVVEDDLGG